MRKMILVFLVAVIISGGLLWTGTEISSAAEKKSTNHISPGNILYPLDRLFENISVFFMSNEKKVSFYLDRSIERYAEANAIVLKGKADKALELYKEGMQTMGKALEVSKECKKKNIKLTGTREKMRDVMNEGRNAFNGVRKILKPEKVTEVAKEMAAMLKVQMDLFLNLD